MSQEAWWRPSYKGDREQERGEWENQRPRLSAYVAEHDPMGANPALALSPADPADQEVLPLAGEGIAGGAALGAAAAAVLFAAAAVHLAAGRQHQQGEQTAARDHRSIMPELPAPANRKSQVDPAPAWESCPLPKNETAVCPQTAASRSLLPAESRWRGR